MSQIYTAEQWDKLEPVLRRLAHGSVLMAREVLVEGLRPAEVARRHEMSRQSVSQIVSRIRKILKDEGRPGLVPVVLWIPQELENQLESLDQDYVVMAIRKLIAEG
ncbi:TrfB-related DNA-binding protein [Pseudomonas sp. P5_152]|uniref:TrfB-related DNA-binding protein n=1 Tax=Pseudomonas sp. P5_152 TaxID=3043442 RepID=UPI002A3703E7|nr:TrfB-related DNA-binding protein [Pseudomonas sp. P5_152]MDX9668630.1 TrfB-related DNA-binding protein [Pseudomonas sp. P5_152]